MSVSPATLYLAVLTPTFRRQRLAFRCVNSEDSSDRFNEDDLLPPTTSKGSRTHFYGQDRAARGVSVRVRAGDVLQSHLKADVTTENVGRYIKTGGSRYAL